MRFRAIFLSPLFVLPLFGEVGQIEFNRDVRPILSDKCFACHASDAASKKIALRLDSEAAAKADLGGRHAIVAGDAAASELVSRITAESKGKRMPPAYSGLLLSDKEKETLTAWVAQGAKWQKHWSLIPPVTPKLPAARESAKNAIDLFVGERLDREGLKASPEASRETLLRRVSLDLTGLPPTLEEIDSFLRDKSANAYEKQVDRLLASPRYGERMAARWLDAARYADSNGYQYDAERVMWRWRDWVIDAFNKNQPFDRFTLEQIAGDLLPNATLDQKIATGFNRNHRANTEDGIIPEEYAVEYVVDRVETTSTVFMGLTLGCARCHNHKYDPLTQKEFYQVFAYFNNVPEMGRAMKFGNSPPLIPAPTREQQRTLQGMDARIDAIQAWFRERDLEIAAGQRMWEKGLTAGKSEEYWAPQNGLLAALPMETPAESKQEDGRVPLVGGKIGLAASFDGKAFLNAGTIAPFDIEDRFTMSAWVYSDVRPNGSLLTRMVDAPKGKGYGVYLNDGKIHVHITSNYADDAFRLESETALDPNRWYHLAVTYSGSRMAEGVQIFVDGKPAKIKVILDSLYRPIRNNNGIVKDPFRIGAGGGPEHRFRGLIDDVRIYDRQLSSLEVQGLALGAPLQSIAAKGVGARNETDKFVLRSYYLESGASDSVRAQWKKLGLLVQEKEAFVRTLPTVMVMAEQPVRRDTFLLMRGAYNAPGEKVLPGVPAVLPPLPQGAPNNRLGFAEWLIAKENPLLARVTVNRFWQMYFGTGLVKTAEDFGMQGEWPSHPELLDWLATEFVRTGWNVKELQKLIVMSATYRQSSKTTPDLQQKDPENRLLSRGPRYRLPAEMVRDQALAVSGLLVEKVGGPSVKPYQPAGLWKEVGMQGMDYAQGTGDDLHRRGLYTFWKRTSAPPMMATFDSAMRESCVVRENRTNTPLQALNLMNDVTFLEASRFVAQRMMKEGGLDRASRLRHGFRVVTGRQPSAVEEKILDANLSFHLDYFAGNADRVKSFLAQGESPVDPALNARELAAYTEIASLLFNLDEVVTKD